MKANQLKASSELAYVVLGGLSPIVTESARIMYEYANNERTDRIRVCDRVGSNQSELRESALYHSKHAEGLPGW